MATATMHDWLNEHGDFLYRFALARLRDPHLAEDVVQEKFLAAIKSPPPTLPRNLRRVLGL